jgi:hypothetical protein
MMASATKGSLDIGSFSIQDRQQPSSIVPTIARFFWISPDLKVSILGSNPGFFTMKAINSAGFPPIGKNSKPDCVTNPANTS